jgi:hypothetical protein
MDSSVTNLVVLVPSATAGMPARVKSNQCIPKGVANGANAEIYHIDWKPSTTFVRMDDGAWAASAPPANIYVCISKSANPTRFPGLPPSWPPSVMPIYQTRASFKVNKRSISIRGFPIVPAFGTTVHGVQGDTRDEVVVTDLRAPRHVDRHALYVALSRVRTRAGVFWIGKKPNDSDFNFFSPEQDVLDEDRRLRELAAATERKQALQ